MKNNQRFLNVVAVLASSVIFPVAADVNNISDCFNCKAQSDALDQKNAVPVGINLTKIANDGSILPDSAKLGTRIKDWVCTLDKMTGLLWEVKTVDGGLRDMNNSYSWYNSDNASNGGFVGSQNGGTCTGNISCDTQSYIIAINKLKLCGKSDWRIPKKLELLSIADYGRYAPAIDSAYFPNSEQFELLRSASLAAFDSSDAWIVYFNVGGDWGYKYYSNPVRLVRGGQ
jgi:hypothetical protein